MPRLRVLESTIFGSKRQVPLDQRVDSELLVALAGEATTVTDLGDQCCDGLGHVGAGAANGSIGASMPAIRVEPRL